MACSSVGKVAPAGVGTDSVRQIRLVKVGRTDLKILADGNSRLSSTASHEIFPADPRSAFASFVTASIEAKSPSTTDAKINVDDSEDISEPRDLKGWLPGESIPRSASHD